MRYNSPPRLMEFAESEEERHAIFTIELSLGELFKQCERFKAAIHLFDLALHQSHEAQEAELQLREEWKKNPDRRRSDWPRDDLIDVYYEWLDIAICDGAMTIRHFYDAAIGARSFLEEVPSLEKFVDKIRLNAAWKLLRKEFADAVEVRNAVAHKVEPHQGTKGWLKHALKEPASANGMVAGVGGIRKEIRATSRTLTVTYKGKAVSYSLSEANLNLLDNIRGEIWASFPDGRNQPT